MCHKGQLIFLFFFRFYTFKYNLPIDLFNNCINKLIIYGFAKLSIKKIIS